MLFAAIGMQPEILTLVKSERERQIPYDIPYMWNLKYGTNLPIKQKQTHRHGELTRDCQEGEGVGWTGSFGLVDANYYILNG